MSKEHDRRSDMRAKDSQDKEQEDGHRLENGSCAKRPGTNHKEEEQCRRGRHASPGEEEHESRGAVSRKPTCCSSGRGAASKESTHSQ